MENGKHIWLWIVIIMVAFWSTPIFMSADSSKRRIQSELNSVHAQFGEEAHNQIVDNANHLYQVLIIDTGLQQFVDNRAVTSKEMKDSEQLYGKSLTLTGTATNAYLTNALANWYGLTLRVQLLLIWLPLTAPFLLGAAGDGYVTRKIKLSSIGFFSSNAFSASSHLLIFFCFLPVLYIISPIAMSPFWLPLMAIIAGFAIHIVIRNAQRFWD